MKLREGDLAPDFAAVSHTGDQVSLREFRGRKAVVVYFYPKDGTPVCTKEACAFRDSFQEFVDADAVVIGVSGDSAERHGGFASKHSLPFHLVSDADGSLRKAFGVPKLLGFLPGRVTYVIDKEGIIRLVHSAAFAHAEHVQKALDALRARPAAPSS
jgi:peroxiredoxin Q/BCP